MRLFQWGAFIWVILMTILVSLAVGVNRTKSVTETRTFCAYGRIFAEFEDNGKVWGVLMLDFYGRPIPCDETKEPEIRNTI